MQKIPLVKVLACFIPGIILGSRFCSLFIPLLKFQFFSLIFLILTLTISVIFFKTRLIIDILIIPTLLILGICITSLNLKTPKIANCKQTIQGTIYQKPVLKDNSVLLPIKIHLKSNKTLSFRTQYKVNLYTTKDTNLIYLLEPGDQIICDTWLKEIQNNNNPDEFNYKRYANGKGIFYSGYASTKNISFFKKRKSDINKTIFHIQEKCFSIFNKNIPNKEVLGVASAILLGRKDYLDNQIRQNYINAGAIHVMAVSGLHVGIIYMALSFILRFMRSSRKLILIQFFIIISFIWFYAILTGLSPSVLRASLMFSLIHLARITRRDVSLFNTLAFVAFILLFHNPLLLYNVGFQLSFIAVSGIVYYQPVLFNLVKTNNKAIDFFSSLLSVTIAAQLVTAPLVLYYFNQFPIYFWLSNLFLTPFIFLALVLSIILICFSWSPILTKVISFLLTKCIVITNTGIRFIDELDHSVIKDIHFPYENIFLYFALLILLTIYLKKKDLFFIKGLLTLSVAIILVNTFKTIKSDTPIITIYNIPNSIYLGFYTNETKELIYQSDSIQKEKLMDFYFYKHWLANGIKKNEINFNQLSNKKTDNKGTIIYFNNKEIINIIGTNKKVIDPYNLCSAPYLLINNPDTFKIPKETKFLVFNSSTTDFTKTKWNMVAKKNNLKIIDISKVGAYNIQLE